MYYPSFYLRLFLSCVGICVASSLYAESTNRLDSDTARILVPNDEISITVYQEDDLATKAIIDTNGFVMLPLLGSVKVGGLTIATATKTIETLYNKDYLVNPRVNLTMEHFADRRFAILGEVQHPGDYDFPQNESLDLLEAVAVAGGYTRLGSPSKVDVRRIEGGLPRIYHEDAEKLANDPGRKPFEIRPGDVIVVGQRNF